MNTAMCSAIVAAATSDRQGDVGRRTKLELPPSLAAGLLRAVTSAI
jgi:hypothetical protein